MHWWSLCGLFIMISPSLSLSLYSLRQIFHIFLIIHLKHNRLLIDQYNTLKTFTTSFRNTYKNHKSVIMIKMYCTCTCTSIVHGCFLLSYLYCFNVIMDVHILFVLCDGLYYRRWVTSWLNLWRNYWVPIVHLLRLLKEQKRDSNLRRDN